MDLDIQDHVNAIKDKITKAVVVFDLETTDADVNSAEIVQFSGVRINTNGTSQTLNFTCRPSKSIHKGATDVHGISNDAVKDCPAFSTFTGKIQTLFKDADTAGYNLRRFDVKILGRQMAENGFEDFLKDIVVYDAYVVFCSHASRKLADALRFYTNEEIQDAHDAFGDVKTTIKVIAKQLEREGTLVEATAKICDKPKEDKPKYSHIIDQNGKLIMNFGKHQGKTLDQVPRDYFQFILGKDFPEETKKLIKDFLKEKRSAISNNNRKK